MMKKNARRQVRKKIFDLEAREDSVDVREEKYFGDDGIVVVNLEI